MILSPYNPPDVPEPPEELEPPGEDEFLCIIDEPEPGENYKQWLLESLEELLSDDWENYYD